MSIAIKHGMRAMLLFGLTGCSQSETPNSKQTPSTQPQTNSVLRVWNFDEDKFGELPPGWVRAETNPTQAVVNWQVIGDPTAPSPQKVFSLTRTQNTGGTFNLAIAQDVSIADLDLSVKMKANNGDEDQGGGLIWRCQDASNYYVCRLNPLESNFRVYRVVAANRTQLGSADVKADSREWVAIRAVMVRDHIVCYLNNDKLLEVFDDTFKNAGMIGLWTKADATSSFDDLTLAKPNRE